MTSCVERCAARRCHCYEEETNDLRLLTSEKRCYRLGEFVCFYKRICRERISFGGDEVYYEISYLREILVVNLAAAAS